MDCVGSVSDEEIALGDGVSATGRWAMGSTDSPVEDGG
jgi:hypothetical protein